MSSTRGTVWPDTAQGDFLLVIGPEDKLWVTMSRYLRLKENHVVRPSQQMRVVRRISDWREADLLEKVLHWSERLNDNEARP